MAHIPLMYGLNAELIAKEHDNEIPTTLLRCAKRILRQETIGNWIQLLLENYHNGWLLFIALRIQEMRNGREKACLVACGGGFDFVVLINTSELPRDVRTIPRIAVDACLGSVKEEGSFFREDPMQHYGVLTGDEILRDHVVSELSTGASEVRVFLDTNTIGFVDVTQGSIENKRIVRYTIQPNWRVDSAVRVNAEPSIFPLLDKDDDSLDLPSSPKAFASSIQASYAAAKKPKVSAAVATKKPDESAKDGSKVEAVVVSTPAAAAAPKETAIGEEEITIAKAVPAQKPEEGASNKKKAPPKASAAAKSSEKKNKKTKKDDQNKPANVAAAASRDQASNGSAAEKAAETSSKKKQQSISDEVLKPFIHTTDSLCYYFPFCLKCAKDCGGNRKASCKQVSDGVVSIPPDFDEVKKKAKNRLKTLRRTQKAEQGGKGDAAKGEAPKNEASESKAAKGEASKDEASKRESAKSSEKADNAETESEDDSPSPVVTKVTDNELKPFIASSKSLCCYFPACMSYAKDCGGKHKGSCKRVNDGEVTIPPNFEAMKKKAKNRLQVLRHKAKEEADAGKIGDASGQKSDDDDDANKKPAAKKPASEGGDASGQKVGSDDGSGDDESTVVEETPVRAAAPKKRKDSGGSTKPKSPAKKSKKDNANEDGADTPAKSSGKKSKGKASSKSKKK